MNRCFFCFFPVKSVQWFSFYISALYRKRSSSFFLSLSFFFLPADDNECTGHLCVAHHHVASEDDEPLHVTLLSFSPHSCVITCTFPALYLSCHAFLRMRRQASRHRCPRLIQFIPWGPQFSHIIRSKDNWVRCSRMKHHADFQTWQFFTKLSVTTEAFSGAVLWKRCPLVDRTLLALGVGRSVATQRCPLSGFCLNKNKNNDYCGSGKWCLLTSQMLRCCLLRYYCYLSLSPE